MRLSSQSFEDGGCIPDGFAFCTPHPEQHAALSDNRNPELNWTEIPAETRSFAIVCTDGDAPAIADDVNQAGRTLPVNLLRADFHHWVMIDVPEECHSIEAGACSHGVTIGGKQTPSGPAGARQGRNNYTDWFAGDADMGGTYNGYDGPGPPWNDEQIHRYRFTLYALDTEHLDVKEGFGASEALAAMEGHILGSASLTGTYTMNPTLRDS